MANKVRNKPIRKLEMHCLYVAPEVEPLAVVSLSYVGVLQSSTLNITTKHRLNTISSAKAVVQTQA